MRVRTPFRGRSSGHGRPNELADRQVEQLREVLVAGVERDVVCANEQVAPVDHRERLGGGGKDEARDLRKVVERQVGDHRERREVGAILSRRIIGCVHGASGSEQGWQHVLLIADLPVPDSLMEL